jgi:hypothetical protein
MSEIIYLDAKKQLKTLSLNKFPSRNFLGHFRKIGLTILCVIENGILKLTSSDLKKYGSAIFLAIF